MHGDQLDDTEQVDTALCSAQRLEEIMEEVHDVLERETVISNHFHDLDFVDEEDEYDEEYTGLQMVRSWGLKGDENV